MHGAVLTQGSMITWSKYVGDTMGKEVDTKHLGFLSGRGLQFTSLYQVKHSPGKNLCCFEVDSVVYTMETALCTTKVCVVYTIIIVIVLFSANRLCRLQNHS